MVLSSSLMVYRIFVKRDLMLKLAIVKESELTSKGKRSWIKEKESLATCVPIEIGQKLDNIASKFALKFGSYAPVFFLTLTPPLFFILLSDCLIFLSSRTGFPGLLHLVLFTVLSVYNVVHCMSARWVSFSTLTGKKRVNPPLRTILSHPMISPSSLLPLTLLICKLNPLLNANMGSFPLSFKIYFR